MMIASGITLGAWTVRAVGDSNIQAPDTIVSTGPYAYGRNPMDVAWTVLYLGIALLIDTVWVVLVLPFVLVTSHYIVRQEERRLAETFGGEYQAYRKTVRRYL